MPLIRNTASLPPPPPNSGRNAEVTAASQVQPPKALQWGITPPRYKMQDLILDSATSAQLLDVISYSQNRELLFIHWGLAERFASLDGLAVNLYGPPGTGKTMAAHAIVNDIKIYT